MRLRIFDSRGRLVTVLAERRLPAGLHSVDWSGADARGRRVPAGVYFYRLDAGPTTQTRKLVVMDP